MNISHRGSSNWQSLDITRNVVRNLIHRITMHCTSYLKRVLHNSLTPQQNLPNTLHYTVKNITPNLLYEVRDEICEVIVLHDVRAWLWTKHVSENSNHGCVSRPTWSTSSCNLFWMERKEKMMSFFLFKGVGNINHGDQDSVLYSWGRHSTLTVPLFTLKTVRKYWRGDYL